jgi:hypothetical protein
MNYRYQPIQETTSDISGSQYYVNNIYPDIPFANNDNYVITVLGDRLDLMALDFYGDVDLWWIIASANSLPGDSLFPPIGAQLRIPTDIVSIVNSYKQINIVR